MLSLCVCATQWHMNAMRIPSCDVSGECCWELGCVAGGQGALEGAKACWWGLEKVGRRVGWAVEARRHERGLGMRMWGLGHKVGSQRAWVGTGTHERRLRCVGGSWDVWVGARARVKGSGRGLTDRWVGGWAGGI